MRHDKLDDEITRFAKRDTNGQIESALPLLDHLSQAHPDIPPAELLERVDAAVDRLYRAKRAFFAGHRWLDKSPETVAGFLLGHASELQFDSATRSWSYTGTQWTVNIMVL